MPRNHSLRPYIHNDSVCDGQAETGEALAEIAPKPLKDQAKGKVDELRSQVKMAQEQNSQHVEQVASLKSLREKWREHERGLEEAGVSFSVARLRESRARSPTSSTSPSSPCKSPTLQPLGPTKSEIAASR
jgi:small-conductance mechanosensitive channel